MQACIEHSHLIVPTTGQHYLHSNINQYSCSSFLGPQKIRNSSIINQWPSLVEAGHDTTSCYVDILNFLKNYDNIQLQHGRHLPVDFCYTVYSTNTIRGAQGHSAYYNSKYNTAYFVVRVSLRYKLGVMKKVPLSCRIFPTSAIQKLLIKSAQNRKLKSHVTVSCLLWMLLLSFA